MRIKAVLRYAREGEEIGEGKHLPLKPLLGWGFIDSLSPHEAELEGNTKHVDHS